MGVGSWWSVMVVTWGWLIAVVAGCYTLFLLVDVSCCCWWLIFGGVP